MMTGREHEPGVTLERFYEVVTAGRHADIDAMLA